MPAIRTFAEPVDDVLTVRIPREYSSYSFEVVLVPFVKERHDRPDFVDFLCNCPAEEGDLDLSRDSDDGSGRAEAFA